MDREPTTQELQLQVDELTRRVEDSIRGAEKMAEKLADQYREDKRTQNEWRGTVNDFIAILRGQKSALYAAWSILISLIGVAISIYAALKPGG